MLFTGDFVIMKSSVSLMEKIYIFNELTKIFYSILSCTKLRKEMTGIVYSYKVWLCLSERRQSKQAKMAILCLGFGFGQVFSVNLAT